MKKKLISIILSLVMATVMTSTVVPTFALEQNTNKVPVTLKIWGVPSGVVAPAGPQTDPIALEIQKRTGITMDMDFKLDEQKLSVMIASGDLPDLLCASYTKGMKVLAKQLIESGSIIDMNSLVNSNAPILKKNFSKVLDYSKNQLSNATGKLYFIPGQIATNGTKPMMQFTPRVRWDYFKELGSPEIKTTDDLANLLIQMVKKHPKTASGKPFYAAGLNTDWLPINTLIISGLPNGVIWGSIFDMKDASPTPFLYSNPSNPLYTGAKFWNKLYRAGVLDPDSFTQKYAQFTQKCDDQRYAMIYANWIAATSNAALAKINPNLGYMPIPPASGTAAYETGSVTMPYGDGAHDWCISTNCKNPDRAMDFLEFVFNPDNAFLINNGPEGVNYKTNKDGYKVFTPEFIKAFNSNQDWRQTTGVNKYYHLSGVSSGSILQKQVIDLTQDDNAFPTASLPSYQKEWLKHYNTTGEADLLAKRVKIYSSNNTFDSFLIPTPDDMSRINAKISTLVGPGLAKAILTKNDNDYTKAIAKLMSDLKAVGSDKYDAWVKTANAKTKENAKAWLN